MLFQKEALILNKCKKLRELIDEQNVDSLRIFIIENPDIDYSNITSNGASALWWALMPPVGKTISPSLVEALLEYIKNDGNNLINPMQRFAGYTPRQYALSCIDDQKVLAVIITAENNYRGTIDKKSKKNNLNDTIKIPFLCQKNQKNFIEALYVKENVDIDTAKQYIVSLDASKSYPIYHDKCSYALAQLLFCLNQESDSAILEKIFNNNIQNRDEVLALLKNLIAQKLMNNTQFIESLITYGLLKEDGTEALINFFIDFWLERAYQNCKIFAFANINIFNHDKLNTDEKEFLNEILLITAFQNKKQVFKEKNKAWLDVLSNEKILHIMQYLKTENVDLSNVAEKDFYSKFIVTAILLGFTKNLILENIVFENQDLRGCDFNGVQINGAIFKNCNLPLIFPNEKNCKKIVVKSCALAGINLIDKSKAVLQYAISYHNSIMCNSLLFFYKGLNSELLMLILAIKNDDGETALQVAIKHQNLDFLNAIFFLFYKLEKDQLTAVLNRGNDAGQTALQIAIELKNLEIIAAMCSFHQELDSTQLLSVLSITCEVYGITALHYAIASQDQEIIEALLSLLYKLEKEQLTAVLTIRDVNQVTVLHEAIYYYTYYTATEPNLEIVSAICLLYQGIHTAALAAVLRQVNPISSKNSAVIKALLPLLNTLEKKQLMGVWGKEQWRYALYEVIYFNNLALFKALLSLLQKLGKGQLTAVLSMTHSNIGSLNERYAGNTVLHEVIASGNVELLEVIVPFLLKLKKEQLVAILSIKNDDARTALHVFIDASLMIKIKQKIASVITPLYQVLDTKLLVAVLSEIEIGLIFIDNSEIIKVIFPLFNKLEKGQLIDIWNIECWDYALNKFFFSKNLEALNIILLLLHKLEAEQLVAVLGIQDRLYGRTVLHGVAYSDNVKIFESIASLLIKLEKKQLRTFLDIRNHFGETALQAVILSENLAVISAICSLYQGLDTAQLLSILSIQASDTKRTILHTAIYYQNVKIIKAMLPLFDRLKTEQLTAILSIRSGDNEKTPLQAAISSKNLAIISVICSLYKGLDTSQLLSILRIQALDDGRTVLHMVINVQNLEIIKAIFPLFYKLTTAQLTVVLSIISSDDGKTALHDAIDSQKIRLIKSILSLFRKLKTEQLAAVLSIPNDEWRTVLSAAIDSENLKIVKIICSLYEQLEVADLRAVLRITSSYERGVALYDATDLKKTEIIKVIRALYQKINTAQLVNGTAAFGSSSQRVTTSGAFIFKNPLTFESPKKTVALDAFSRISLFSETSKNTENHFVLKERKRFERVFIAGSVVMIFFLFLEICNNLIAKLYHFDH